MLKLTWNRYVMLMAMKELLVNANFDIIDYSRQNVSALFMKLLLDKKKKKKHMLFKFENSLIIVKKQKKQKKTKKQSNFSIIRSDHFALNFLSNKNVIKKAYT